MPPLARTTPVKMHFSLCCDTNPKKVIDDNRNFLREKDTLPPKKYISIAEKYEFASQPYFTTFYPKLSIVFKKKSVTSPLVRKNAGSVMLLAFGFSFLKISSSLQQLALQLLRPNLRSSFQDLRPLRRMRIC